MSLFFLLNPKRAAGGHFPPIHGGIGYDSKGHALGEWKRKKKKKLLALKDEILPEATDTEFINLVDDLA